MLEGLLHIMEEQVELRIEGEHVLDGGLFDPDSDCRDQWRQTRVGGFGKAVTNRVDYTVGETVSARKLSFPPPSVICIAAAF